MTTEALAPIMPSANELELVKRTVARGATADELRLYLYDCQRHGVHPLDKLLHFTKRGGRYTPITSIDLMRTRAAETGEYAGNDDAVFSGTPKGNDFAASVTVHRLVGGEARPFAATARWSEYCPPGGQDQMWQKMPHTMLGKCAEALALRKGFPKQLAGLYAREEMDQAPERTEPREETPTGFIQPDGSVRVVQTTMGEYGALTVVLHTGETLRVGARAKKLQTDVQALDKDQPVKFTVSNGWITKMAYAPAVLPDGTETPTVKNDSDADAPVTSGTGELTADDIPF